MKDAKSLVSHADIAEEMLADVSGWPDEDNAIVQKSVAHSLASIARSCEAAAKALEAIAWPPVATKSKKGH